MALTLIGNIIADFAGLVRPVSMSLFAIFYPVPDPGLSKILIYASYKLVIGNIKIIRFNVTNPQLNCHICHPSEPTLLAIFVLSMNFHL